MIYALMQLLYFQMVHAIREPQLVWWITGPVLLDAKVVDNILTCGIVSLQPVRKLNSRLQQQLPGQEMLSWFWLQELALADLQSLAANVGPHL